MGTRVADVTSVAFPKWMDITYKLAKQAVLHGYSHTLRNIGIIANGEVTNISLNITFPEFDLSSSASA